MQPCVCTGVSLGPSASPRRMWVRGTDTNVLMLTLLSVPRIIKSFVCAPVVLGLAGHLLQREWILRSFTVLKSFIKKDGMLTVTWLSGRSMRKSWSLPGFEGSPWELVVNVLTKLYGQPGSNGPLLCYSLMKRNRGGGCSRLTDSCPDSIQVVANSPPGGRTSSPIWWQPQVSSVIRTRTVQRFILGGQKVLCHFRQQQYRCLYWVRMMGN